MSAPQVPNSLRSDWLAALLTIAVIAGGVTGIWWLWSSVQPRPGPLPNLIGMHAGRASDVLHAWREDRHLAAYRYEITDFSRLDRGGVEDETGWIVVATDPAPGTAIEEDTDVALKTLSQREVRFYTRHPRMPRVRVGVRPGVPLRGVLRDLRRPGGWPVSLVDYREAARRPRTVGSTSSVFRTTGRTFPPAGKRLRMGQRIIVEIWKPRPPHPSSGEGSQGHEGPPGGWTNDALTPGYTGCRQGYPGGRISGVYWWRPIPC